MKSTKSKNPTIQSTLQLGQLYQSIIARVGSKSLNLQSQFKQFKKSKSDARPLIQCTLHLGTLYAREVLKTRKRRLTTHNHGFDDENDDYRVKEGEIWQERFQILRTIGRGSFGQVVEALELSTKEKRAIKIIKNRAAFTAQAQTEMHIVRFLNERDPDDKTNTGAFL